MESWQAAPGVAELSFLNFRAVDKNNMYTMNHVGKVRGDLVAQLQLKLSALKTCGGVGPAGLPSLRLGTQQTEIH